MEKTRKGNKKEERKNDVMMTRNERKYRERHQGRGKTEEEIK